MDAGASARAGEEFGQAGVTVEPGDALEQFGSFLDGKWPQVAGIEETEERLLAVGDASKKALGGGGSGEDGMILDKCPPGALIGHIQLAEQRIEVLDQDQHCAVSYAGNQVLTEGV